MNHLIAFVNEFLVYLIMFMVMIVLAITGISIGSMLRKRKDAKEQREGLHAE